MKKEHLFEQILGIKELEILCIQRYSTKYVLSVRSILAQGICPKCGKKCSKVKSYYERTVRDLPISGKSVELSIEVRQFECNCGNYFSEAFSFVRPHKNLTIRYEEYLYYQCKGADLQYVASKQELDWKTVDEIFYTYSSVEIGHRRDWEKITHLALDEIALKKGHNNYVVIVLDLISGVILDILEHRDKAFLIKYFRDKGDSFCKQIKLFCSDMWSAYLNCAKEVFSNAIIVADRFHFFFQMPGGLGPCQKKFSIPIS